LGGETLLASPAAEDAPNRIEIEILGGASQVTVAEDSGNAD
jgi:hypothetical protein